MKVYQVLSNHTRHVDPEVDTNESRGQTGVAEPTLAKEPVVSAACGSAKGSALEGFFEWSAKAGGCAPKKRPSHPIFLKTVAPGCISFFYKKWRDRTIQINQRHKNGRICGLQNPESLQ